MKEYIFIADEIADESAKKTHEKRRDDKKRDERNARAIVSGLEWRSYPTGRCASILCSQDMRVCIRSRFAGRAGGRGVGRNARAIDSIASELSSFWSSPCQDDECVVRGLRFEDEVLSLEAPLHICTHFIASPATISATGLAGVRSCGAQSLQRLWRGRLNSLRRNLSRSVSMGC